jgi:hypothetical protein
MMQLVPDDKSSKRDCHTPLAACPRKRIEPGAGTARAMIGIALDADIDDQDGS